MGFTVNTFKNLVERKVPENISTPEAADSASSGTAADKGGLDCDDYGFAGFRAGLGFRGGLGMPGLEIRVKGCALCGLKLFLGGSSLSFDCLFEAGTTNPSGRAEPKGPKGPQYR